MNANVFPAEGEDIGQWKLIRFRQATDFSTQWYDVRHRETGKLGFCEVRIVAEDLFDSFLMYEAMIVKETTLLGLGSFQRFVEYGKAPDGSYVYLITEGLGPTLESLRSSLPEIAENRFTLATSLYIGQKMLFALQELHEAGYLHRCIKDECFALNRTLSSEVVMIGTFLMRRWMKSDGSGALPARVFAAFRGTLNYSSANAQRQREQHRLDDVWSWFYLVVYLTVGTLPWMAETLPANLVWEQLPVCADAKEAASQETTWLDTAPPEFKKILEYLKTTPSDAVPAYSRLANLLGTALKRTVDANGGEFKLDWEPGGAYYDQLRPLLPNDGV